MKRAMFAVFLCLAVFQVSLVQVSLVQVPIAPGSNAERKLSRTAAERKAIAEKSPLQCALYIATACKEKREVEKVVSKLRGMAKFYIEMGRAEKAESMLSRALEFAEAFEDVPSRARLIGRVAQAYIEIGRYDKVPDALAKIEDSRENAKTLVRIAEAYIEADQSDKALEMLSRALTMQTAHDKRMIEDIATNYAGAGQCDKALEIVASKIDKCYSRISIFVRIAEKCAESGQKQGAIEIAGRALDRIIERDPGFFKHDLFFLAEAFTKVGQCDQSLRIVDLMRDRSLKSRAIYSVVQSFIDSDQYERAAETLLQSVRIAELIENPGLRIPALSLIAHQYARIGQYDKALQLVETNPSFSSRVFEIVSIAEKCNEAGQEEKSHEILDRALEFADSMSEQEDRAAAWCSIAERYAEFGRIEAAHEMQDRVFVAALSTSISNRNIGLLRRIAHNYYELGQPQSAWKALYYAYESVREGGESSSGRSGQGNTWEFIRIARDYTEFRRTFKAIEVLFHALQTTAASDSLISKVAALAEIEKVYIEIGMGVNENARRILRIIVSESMAQKEAEEFPEEDLSDVMGSGSGKQKETEIPPPCKGLMNDSGQRLSSSLTESVALGDLDGDGDLDAFVGNTMNVSYTGEDTIWINDGSGNFCESNQDFGQARTSGLALGDLDGDGDLDAAVNISHFSGPDDFVEIWLNDGVGKLHKSEKMPTDFSGSIFLGDLDGDGDLDIMARPSPWLNDGKGGFQMTGQRFSIVGSYSDGGGVLGDLDGDGDLDFIDGNSRGPNTVWSNNGSGTFSDSGQRLKVPYTEDVALGDLDGDGDLDAFFANGETLRRGRGQSESQPDHVWLNDGSGTFRDSGQRLGGSTSKVVELADLDGDGDLDAFVVYCHEGGEAIWLNDGKGVFHEGDFCREDRSRRCSDAVALGDLDNDGDIDAFIGYCGEPDEVWFNTNRKNTINVVGKGGQ